MAKRKLFQVGFEKEFENSTEALKFWEANHGRCVPEGSMGYTVRPPIRVSVDYKVGFVPAKQEKKEIDKRAHGFACPTLMTRAADKNPYRSPVDGKPIMNHLQRVDDLKRHGCREVDPSETLAKRDGYTNPEFCRKRGLKVSPKKPKKEIEITLPDDMGMR